MQLQRVKKAVNHVIPSILQLHWLLILHQIIYKVSILVYQVHTYVINEVITCVDLPSWRQSLCNASSEML